MRGFLSDARVFLFKKRSSEVRIVVIGMTGTVIGLISLLWLSYGGPSDGVAQASGALVGGLVVVAAGAILGWRKAESRNHDDSRNS